MSAARGNTAIHGNWIARTTFLAGMMLVVSIVAPANITQADDRELLDLAVALRALDQSFHVSGHAGAGAWTAASTYRQPAVADSIRELKRRAQSQLQEHSKPRVGHNDTMSSWPANPRGLVFFWRHDMPVQLQPRGQAEISENGLMQLTNGAFLVPGINTVLLAACRSSQQVSIETVLRSQRERQSGPARIITFSTDSTSRNFTLGQQGNHLMLRLRTPRTGSNSTNPEVKLCLLRKAKWQHIVVAYRPGLLRCYQDGEMVLESQEIKGDFRNWTLQQLLLGDEQSGHRGWSGSLERIALFNRFINDDEARARHKMFAKSSPFNDHAALIDSESSGRE